MAGLLNDLTREAAMLAAARGFKVVVRLVRPSEPGAMELRAYWGSGEAGSEYVRRLAMSELERRGAEEVAHEFVREARFALAGATHLTMQKSPARSVR